MIAATYTIGTNNIKIAIITNMNYVAATFEIILR
jgi:hypothetical protein